MKIIHYPKTKKENWEQWELFDVPKEQWEALKKLGWKKISYGSGLPSFFTSDKELVEKTAEENNIEVGNYEN